MATLWKRHYCLATFLLGATTACGQNGPAPGPSTPPLPETKTLSRSTAAAQQTAIQNASCQAVRPFYFEIGDATGPLTSASVGGDTYTATTTIPTASASKWLFGAYVAEVRAGVLSQADVRATRMQSGYVSMGSICGQDMTVVGCFGFGSNAAYTPASLDRFHYDSGHFQDWGVRNGLAFMRPAAIAAEYQSALGSDIPLTFERPLLAGGVITSPSGYAVFLRKILNGSLRIASLLGSSKTCTLPGVCATAEYSPIPEAWSYSLGHWVEDDPARGDGSFSSPGAFGFYPWIDSTKTHYGIVARVDEAGTGAAWDSVLCGRQIRKAFQTGVVQ